MSHCDYSGKTMHESPDLAKKELKRQRNHGTIYRCPHCHKYHISRGGRDAFGRKMVKKIKSKIKEKEISHD